jgi:hypothetical protein
MTQYLYSHQRLLLAVLLAFMSPDVGRGRSERDPSLQFLRERGQPHRRTTSIHVFVLIRRESYRNAVVIFRIRLRPQNVRTRIERDAIAIIRG